MIIGVGCDIVRISRMSKIVPMFNSGIQQHILSDIEIKELATLNLNEEKTSRFLAKHFAAKEAFGKALGTGFRDGIFLKNITIHHNDLGKPFISVENGALDALLEKTEQQDFKIHLSLSDESDLAQAFVIIERL